MYMLYPAREDRAVLVGMIADGNNEIKRYIGDFIDVFRSLCLYIDARFLHHADGALVHTVGFDARRAGLDQMGFHMPRPTFCHLAAARVAGA